MNVVGRRGSSGSGWNWSRPPSNPPRPRPGPPLLPLAGAALLVLLIALALLAIWLSDSDDNSPTGAADTPTPVLSTPVVSSPIPSATPTPTQTATPTPTPTPTPTSSAPLYRLAVFDEGEWQFDALPQAAAYHEGGTIPLLLRIDNALPGAAYLLTIRYTCEGFDLLTAYDHDTGSEPALASGGPGSATADSTVQIPDDPGTDDDDGGAGSLSLWGGSFIAIGALLPSSPCTDEKSLSVSLLASADTLFVMWAVQLSEAASNSDLPLRLVVQLPDGDELSFEIEPASIAPAQP
ncbi:MAG: hypothetical protein IIA23_12370 [Chloroflexi bacterium]|nr:hypothetical protein [Chloroflexota bacterium]